MRMEEEIKKKGMRTDKENNEEMSSPKAKNRKDRKSKTVGSETSNSEECLTGGESEKKEKPEKGAANERPKEKQRMER